MKVVFNTDYTGRHCSARKGAIRSVSSEALKDLKSKRVVTIYREPKETKELKINLETK